MQLYVSRLSTSCNAFFVLNSIVRAYVIHRPAALSPRYVRRTYGIVIGNTVLQTGMLWIKLGLKSRIKIVHSLLTI